MIGIRGEERELGMAVWEARLTRDGKYIVLPNGGEHSFTLIDRETRETVKELDYENIGSPFLQYAGENIIAVTGMGDTVLYITTIEDNE